MVDFADGVGEPPPLLELALRCKQWSTLPEPGNLLDQPAGLIDQMTYALNVYENWSAYLRAERSGDALRMKKSDPQYERFINEILRGKWERKHG